MKLKKPHFLYFVQTSWKKTNSINTHTRRIYLKSNILRICKTHVCRNPANFCNNLFYTQSLVCVFCTRKLKFQFWRQNSFTHFFHPHIKLFFVLYFSLKQVVKPLINVNISQIVIDSCLSINQSFCSPWSVRYRT